MGGTTGPERNSGSPELNSGVGVVCRSSPDITPLPRLIAPDELIAS
jgi:hypothetical protein